MKISQILVLLTSFVLMSCSADEANDGGGASSDEAVSATGDRFFDSAVNMIAAKDDDVSVAQATEIVTAMTADGTVGLGEINQMRFDDPTKNRKFINTAYEKAKKAVLGE